MSTPPPDLLRIDAAPPERCNAALELVFSDLPAEMRAAQLGHLKALESIGQGSSKGLLEAQRGAKLIGAIWVTIQPGRAAGLWPPRIVSGEPTATAQTLLDTAIDWSAKQDMQLLQALLPADGGADAELFKQAGFRHLCNLLYAVCLAESLPDRRPEGPLEYETWSAATESRFVALLKESYEQTLDCPAMNGVRSMEDVLAGYRGTGVFDPARWLLARQNGEDVGCLLLTDHPTAGHWEIVYLGLSPQARGQGLGLQLTRYAQWLARQAGRMRMVLAVDAANVPAIAMYDAAGFKVWDQRSVWSKNLEQL